MARKPKRALLRQRGPHVSAQLEGLDDRASAYAAAVAAAGDAIAAAHQPGCVWRTRTRLTQNPDGTFDVAVRISAGGRGPRSRAPVAQAARAKLAEHLNRRGIPAQDLGGPPPPNPPPPRGQGDPHGA